MRKTCVYMQIQMHDLAIACAYTNPKKYANAKVTQRGTLHRP